VRRVWQHGNGDRRRHGNNLIFLWAIAEIINNNGEFAGKRWHGKPACWQRQQRDEIEAKLIFPTTAVD
jgi:hypothetical protein